jgi:hypothetical protein
MIECTMPSNVNSILKLEKDDPDLELEHELEWLRSLTVEERFQLMFRKSREIADAMIRNGHRKPLEIVKRV